MILRHPLILSSEESRIADVTMRRNCWKLPSLHGALNQNENARSPAKAFASVSGAESGQVDVEVLFV